MGQVLRTYREDRTRIEHVIYQAGDGVVRDYAKPEVKQFLESLVREAPVLVRAFGSNLAELARDHYAALGYKTAHTASEVLKHFATGHVIGTYVYNFTKGTPAKNLPRLALFLYGLGVANDAPLIQDITAHCQSQGWSFAYPPVTGQQPGFLRKR